MPRTKRSNQPKNGWCGRPPKTAKVVPFKNLDKVCTEKVRYKAAMTNRKPPQYSHARAGT
ncbi:MAG: hypothetical protein ABSD42_10505 [Candidatus Bathyarchaeia archaeon]